MNFIKIILVICIILPVALAEDTSLGKSLHQENCIACHAAMTGGDGSVLYTRKDHRVTSLGLLNKQINRCQSSLELHWTSDDIGQVQQFLNINYYQF